MSKESQIMASVSSVLSYIKSQIGTDLLQAKNGKIINLDNDQIEKLSRVIQTSIDANFNKSCGEIIKACQE